MTEKKKIIWTDEYSVGVQELDKQHQRLIGSINALSDLVNNDEIVTLESEPYNVLIWFAREHLHYEEFLLKKHSYPLTVQHKKQHEFYLDGLDALTEPIKKTGGVPAKVCYDFACDWLIQHILVEDMKYKPFFEEKGVN